MQIFLYKNNLLCLQSKIKDMTANISELKQFDNWLRKIKNVHYSNKEKVLEAYERVEPLKYNPAISAH